MSAVPLRLLIAAIAIASLALRVWVILPDIGSVAAALWQMLRYFTILTNLAVAGVMILSLARRRRPGAAISAAITTWIIVVGAVYHALLGQDLPFGTLRYWIDHGYHTAVPVLTVIWWIAAAEKSGLRPIQALHWALFPIAYLAYALARGLADGVYPYFFINPGMVGWSGVFLWAAGLFALFTGLGLMLVLAARRLSGVQSA